MTTIDYTTTLVIDKTPEAAFKAITNVRGWWSEEIEGATEKLNDEFTYHHKDLHYCQVRLTEVIPNKKIVWLIKYNYFNFTKDRSEWTGHSITFDISEKDKKTEIRFTQKGLTPALECYDICSKCWTQYVQESLGNLILTGKGQPNAKEEKTIDCGVES